VGGGIAAFLALSGKDTKAATPVKLPTIPTIQTPTTLKATTTTAAATTVPATTAAPATTVALSLPTTVTPETTVAAATTAASVPAGSLDLGHGVSIKIPDKYTQDTSVASVNAVTDGTIKMVAQVLQRTPGESPLALLQEYVNTFDGTFPTVNYSQVIPIAADTSGAQATDGSYVFYRVLNADGTGIRGVIEADRRADGLSYLTDIYRPLSDTSDDLFPQTTLDELHQSFLATAATGAGVALDPPTFTHLTSSHASYVVDGLIAITPPAGWNVDAPGPGRVVFSRPDGQRFLAQKIDAVADLTAAAEKAKADTVALVPSATFGDFTTDTSSRFGFTSARWQGTDPNTGQQLNGFISIWNNPTSGEAFESLEAWVGASQDPPSTPESDFLFHTFDVSINQPRS
jgi:hypothetical protein